MPDPALIVGLLAVLAGLVGPRLAAFVRRAWRRGRVRPPPSSPPGSTGPSLVSVMEGFQDLDGRRARGEIDEETFRREEAELQADFRRWAGREEGPQ